MIKTIYFATGNENKLREARGILEFPIESSKFELDEIQTLDVKEVVRKKVNAAYKILRKPVFVDDVAMNVEAWNGFPGPFVKYISEIDNNRTLLKWVSLEENRAVSITCAIGYKDGESCEVFIGNVDGVLVDPRGEGWGFRPIFQPDGSDKTWGEITDEELNKISHRSIALKKFKEYLKQNEK